jgi:hypothetical protein
MKVNAYTLNDMSGCHSGLVPQIDDLNTVIRNRSKVKIIAGKNVNYGYVLSQSLKRGTFNFVTIAGEKHKNLLIADFAFYSAFTEWNYSFTKGSVIVVDKELFNVVGHTKTHSPVWLGSNGLIYHAEDMEAIIRHSTEYMSLGVVKIK